MEQDIHAYRNKTDKEHSIDCLLRKDTGYAFWKVLLALDCVICDLYTIQIQYEELAQFMTKDATELKIDVDHTTLNRLRKEITVILENCRKGDTIYFYYSM